MRFDRHSFKTAISCVLIVLVATVCAGAGLQETEVEIRNTSGEAKSSWPVFLTVYKIFGGNMDLKSVNPDGFHVTDEAGKEIPHMLRKVTPLYSVGNDQIVVLVPQIGAGQSVRYRISNTAVKGKRETIDLVNNPNNLIKNGGFEQNTAGCPTGFRFQAPAQVSYDTSDRVSGKQSLRIAYPLHNRGALRTESIKFEKDRRYYCSFWAKSKNMSYSGYGLGAGFNVRFEPQALRGRNTIPVRGDRDWFCYAFSAGGHDSWGIPDMNSVAEQERNDKGVNQIWQGGGQAALVLGGSQPDQAILKGDKSGTIWLDDVLLFEQPTITVRRDGPLARVAMNGAIVFERPVEMPRWGVAAHETADRIDAFAMKGERRQVRFGVHALNSLGTVTVSVSPLRGPEGAILSGNQLDLENLDEFAEDYRPVTLGSGKKAEYLLGIDVPENAVAGRYEGTVSFTANNAPLKSLPLSVDVLPITVPNLGKYGYYLGGVYNVGDISGNLKRDDAFYRCYGKVRFNYLMLFDYLVCQMKGSAFDWEGAQRQVDAMRTLGHVTDGIGLYREPNMSEDEPRKWYQIAAGKPDWQGKFAIGTNPGLKPKYQQYARETHEYAKKHNWPTLIYMVVDEPDRPQEVHDGLGWLEEAIPEAYTCADTMFNDMVKTMKYYDLPILDDPTDWTGPLVYDWLRSQKRQFGFCGIGWQNDSLRYQTGLMLASSGARYWHFWHVKGPFEPRWGRVDRMHNMVSASAGINDLRYYLTLRLAMMKNRSNSTASTASRYLTEVFALNIADHDTHLFPYTGVPWEWGDARYYDNWRTTMKDLILKLR